MPLNIPELSPLAEVAGQIHQTSTWWRCKSDWSIHKRVQQSKLNEGRRDHSGEKLFVCQLKLTISEGKKKCINRNMTDLKTKHSILNFVQSLNLNSAPYSSYKKIWCWLFDFILFSEHEFGCKVNVCLFLFVVSLKVHSLECGSKYLIRGLKLLHESMVGGDFLVLIGASI